MANSAPTATPATTAAPAPQSGERPASARVQHGNTVEMPAQFLYDVEEGDPPPLTDDPTPTGLLSEDEGEEQDDSEDDAEAIAEAPETDEPEADGEPEAVKPGVLSVAEAADILLHSPQRINELKGSDRAEAIRLGFVNLTATHQAQAQALIEQAEQQGMQNGYQAAIAIAEFNRLDALDPYEREEEFKPGPEQSAAEAREKRLSYHKLLIAKETGTLDNFWRTPARSAPPPPADPAAQLKLRAEKQVAAVKDESIRSQLRINDDNGKYPTTDAGYDALVADIAALSARPVKPTAPPPEAAAAVRLKTGPKSASSAGTATPGRLTHERLDAMSQAEVERYIATPEGEAEVDRLMATPRRR